MSETAETTENTGVSSMPADSHSEIQNLVSVDRPWLWKPGQSGNISGRPKSKRITEAYHRILDEKGAEAYAQVIANDALTAKKPSDRLAAVQEMTDRTEGRPVQAQLVVNAIDGDTARLLAGLAGALALPDTGHDESGQAVAKLEPDASGESL